MNNNYETILFWIYIGPGIREEDLKKRKDFLTPTHGPWISLFRQRASWTSLLCIQFFSNMYGNRVKDF